MARDDTEDRWWVKRVNSGDDDAWTEVETALFTFVSLSLSLFFYSGSLVSTGAYSCDRRERKNKASNLISAASRVLSPSSAQDLNLALEGKAAKVLFAGSGIFLHLTSHRYVCNFSCFIVGNFKWVGRISSKCFQIQLSLFLYLILSIFRYFSCFIIFNLQFSKWYTLGHVLSWNSIM